MRRVILDTSFILSAVRNKIDFFEKLEHEGFQIIVPKQVIQELKGLGAKLALKIMEKNKFQILGIEGRDADNAIISFAKKNPRAVVATLDAGLKKKIKNSKLVIRQKKRLEVI
jgi:rRNA-processing protein FCF1